MNSLVALSLIGVLGGGYQAPVTARQVAFTSQAMAHKQPSKLNVLGPNMHGYPGPWGLLGVKSIPKKNFKLKDFEPYLAGPGTTVSHLTRRSNTAVQTALVLYDANGTYGWIGSLYAYQIGSLLSHFGVTVTRKGIESYKTGDLAAYTSAYYIGTTYYNSIPASFKTDFVANNNPFCWMGYNLWSVAWNKAGTAWNPAFTNKWGFQFAYLDGTGYPTVNYKNSSLTCARAQYDPQQGDTTILDPTMATVLATSTNGSTTVPYITRSQNLWYIADNPLEYVSYDRGDDRMLAFADTLNDTTGIVTSTEMRAVLRIEDVSAICDSASLRGIADTLYAENIPYVVCVIPDYMDPLGVFNAGVPLEIQMQNSPQFVSDLQYMQSKGAQLIMHGVTHQYSNVPNPVNGVSAADVEFFIVQTDANGNQEPIGPVPEDSASWIKTRIAGGFTMFKEAGFAKPTGWNSPHYYATPTDYTEFGKDFTFSMDRVLTFAKDQNGNLQYLIQYSPYVDHDEYGNHRIPETIGYYDPNGTSGSVNLPSNMIGYAQQIECVRGGWAGMYYHWFLGTTALQQLVDGIKALGYTFVDPSKNTF